MRILLDHNVPESLRHLITDHEVHTAHYLGWDTLRNGELLRRTAAFGLTALAGLIALLPSHQNIGDRIMAKYDPVKDQVAAIYRSHLERKFGDRLVFDEIHVTPRLDEWDEEYLEVRVVYGGDGDLLEPNWLNGLYWQMQPELLELGVTNFTSESYIDKAEIAEWTDEERARLFR